MRMKAMLSPVLAGIVLASALPLANAALSEASFDLKSTEDLHALCAATQEDELYVPANYACRGFIRGAVQYHDAVTDRKNLKPLICYPSTATIVDGEQAFVAWAEVNNGNAELMGEVPVIGLVRALAEKYKCVQ